MVVALRRSRHATNVTARVELQSMGKARADIPRCTHQKILRSRSSPSVKFVCSVANRWRFYDTIRSVAAMVSVAVQSNSPRSALSWNSRRVPAFESLHPHEEPRIRLLADENDERPYRKKQHDQREQWKDGDAPKKPALLVCVWFGHLSNPNFSSSVSSAVN